MEQLTRCPFLINVWKIVKAFKAKTYFPLDSAGPRLLSWWIVCFNEVKPLLLPFGCTSRLIEQSMLEAYGRKWKGDERSDESTIRHHSTVSPCIRPWVLAIVATKAPGDALALMGVIAALGSDCPGKKPGETWRNVTYLESKPIESTFFNLSIQDVRKRTKNPATLSKATSFWFWFTDAPSHLWKEFHLIALLTWGDLAPFKRPSLTIDLESPRVTTLLHWVWPVGNMCSPTSLNAGANLCLPGHCSHSAMG